MVERIKIQNYRCLQHFELRLGDVDVMMALGLNGSGKTTLLYVFSLLQRIAAGTADVGALFGPGDFSFGETAGKVMRFELEASAGGERYLYRLSLDFPERFSGLRVFDESLHCGGECVYEREGERVVRAGSVGAGAPFLLDRHLIALPLAPGGEGGDAAARFREALCRMVCVAPMPLAIGGEISGEGAYLKLDASNLAAWLAAYWFSEPRAYAKILHWLREAIFPDLVSFEFARPAEDAPRRLVFVFEKEGAGVVRTAFGKLSDGEKCEVLAAVLSVKAGLGDCDFCFWDEPDNYLAVSEVRMLLTALRAALKAAGGQFLFSSHSLQALDAVPCEKVKVFLRDSHLEPAYVKDLVELAPDPGLRRFLDLQLLTGSLYHEAE